ncbi:MAG: ion channel [Bacteroidia bacterium]
MQNKRERRVFKNLQRRFKEDKYTGFGSGANSQGARLLGRDGTYNVERRGQPFSEYFSPFHSLVTMSWTRFFFIIFWIFCLVNVFFSILYMFIGFDEFTGFVFNHALGKFFDLLTFSAQTLTTVGYGRVNPIGYWAGIVASFEAMIGLLSFALVTGLLYGRFSRPVIKLTLSKNGVIAPFNDINALMIRIANSRKNQLLECEAIMLLSIIDKDSNKRNFITLELEYSKINALALSWTLVHPINENSPIYGLTEADLLDLNAEFIVMFKAFEDTYSQHVHTRFSYIAEDFIWGAKFLPMYKRSEEGLQTILELDKIGLYEKAELNEIKKASEEA